MKLACSTAAFPADRLEMAIARVAWAGYTTIELALGSEPFPGAEILQRRLQNEDLELAAVRGDRLPGGAPAQSIEEMASIGRAISLTRSLDSSLFVIEAPAEGAMEDLAGVLRLLDSAVAGLRVKICLLNSPGTLLAEPDDFVALWNTGVPRNIGVALDPAGALLSGWDPLNVAALPERPSHLYLNGVSEGRRCLPGTGQPDPQALIEALAAINYSGAATIDLGAADPWAVEPIARELREAVREWLE